MLVLNRREGQALVLNETTIIRILAVEGDHVKIGITAPPDVIIVREELLDPAYLATHTGPKRSDRHHSYAEE